MLSSRPAESEKVRFPTQMLPTASTIDAAMTNSRNSQRPVAPKPPMIYLPRHDLRSTTYPSVAAATWGCAGRVREVVSDHWDGETVPGVSAGNVEQELHDVAVGPRTSARRSVIRAPTSPAG